MILLMPILISKILNISKKKYLFFQKFPMLKFSTIKILLFQYWVWYLWEELWVGKRFDVLGPWWILIPGSETQRNNDSWGRSLYDSISFILSMAYWWWLQAFNQSKRWKHDEMGTRIQVSYGLAWGLERWAGFVVGIWVRASSKILRILTNMWSFKSPSCLTIWCSSMMTSHVQLELWLLLCKQQT